MAFRRVDQPTVVASALAGDFAQDVVKPPARAKPADAPELVTIAQAVTLAGVSRRTIYNWIERGLVRTQRVASGRLRIETSSLFKSKGSAA